MTDSPSDQWLTPVRDEAAERLARIAHVQDELSTLHAEARTAEGRVRVRVNAAGRAGERLATLVGSLVPSAELDAMLTGRPTQADRIVVRNAGRDELDALLASEQRASEQR